MTLIPTLNEAGRAAVPLWQRPWLDSYHSGVPSSIPYPNVPVSTLPDGEYAWEDFVDRYLDEMVD